jgi:hypothetical protein
MKSTGQSFFVAMEIIVPKAGLVHRIIKPFKDLSVFCEHFKK